MTALHTDNQAPGLGLSCSQHSFLVWKGWKSQLSPSTDGVHHSEVQHGILNLSVMCIFLKMQSIQWQWRWWKRVVDWEVYLVILCNKSQRSCSSRVNNDSWQGRKQGKGLPMGSANGDAMQRESRRLLWGCDCYSSCMVIRTTLTSQYAGPCSSSYPAMKWSSCIPVLSGTKSNPHCCSHLTPCSTSCILLP